MNWGLGVGRKQLPLPIRISLFSRFNSLKINRLRQLRRSPASISLLCLVSLSSPARFPSAPAPLPLHLLISRLSFEFARLHPSSAPNWPAVRHLLSLYPIHLPNLNFHRPLMRPNPRCRSS